MTGEFEPLTREEEALFQQHCVKFLTQDGEAPPVTDEVVYAYLTGDATEEERELIEEALLASSAFCDELLEIAKDLEAVERKKRRPVWRGWRFSVPLGRAWAWRAAIGIVLVVAALLVQHWQGGEKLPSARHLAILPIQCEGPSASEAFCDGLAETMTHKVSQLERFERSFWVVPAEIVKKTRVSDPKAAGSRFGVTMALTGRLERSQEEFKLTLDLLDVASPTPKRLRSAEISGAASDLASLQTSVVRQITKMLGLYFLPQESWALGTGNTQVSEAYLSYVEGRGHLLRYEQVSELEKAMAAFKNAIASDSSYALAYTGLAETYWRMFRATSDPDWIARANEECTRSLALDSTLAATHVIRGDIRNAGGEYDLAVTSFERALAIDSTTAGAYNGLAEAYAGAERLDLAEATFRRAIEVKPDYWGGYNDLGLFYYRHGRFEEAADQYRRVAELTPDNHLAFNNLGAMLYYLERWDEARAAFQSSIDIQPNARAYMNLGTIYYIEGDYETAARLTEQAVSLNPNNYKSWSALGNARYWIPGERERARDAYRRAIELAEKRLALNPTDARLRAALASYYVVVDEPEKARTYIDAALESSSDSPFIVYYAGYVYEQLGERDRALVLIGHAIELGYPVREIERDPWLVDLRADPRFQQMLDTQK